MKTASYFLVENQQLNLLASTGGKTGVWTSLVAKQMNPLPTLFLSPNEIV